MLKEFLSQRGISYLERDVSVDRAAAGEVTRLTGQTAVPVTVIDGQTVIGFDRPKLEHLLATTAHGPSLGAAVGDAVRITGTRGLPSATGAYVGGIRPGSLAQRLGLAIGDIITQVNGQQVNDTNDLERIMSGVRAGNQVSVSFSRGGNKISASEVL